MARRSTKFYRKNEEEVMKALGLEPTKNSGAGWLEKEDGQNECIIAQLKSTDAQSIMFSQKDFRILEYNASVAHKIPLFVLQFLNTNEVFLLMKPEDISSINEYIETGACEVKQLDLVCDVKTKKCKPKVKSGGRDAFWKEKEREWEKWQKRSK